MRKSLTLILFSTVLLHMASAASAQEIKHERAVPKKAASEWSDDERISKRLDPDSIRERSAKEATEPYGAHPPAFIGRGAKVNSVYGVGAVIVGRRNPELFMPFELFSRLIADCFDDNITVREIARSKIAPFIAGVLPPERFWSTLEIAASEFIANQRAQHALFANLNAADSLEAGSTIRQQIRDLQQPECSLRASALNKAAVALGRDKLYRVLYEAVAPDMNMYSAEPENAQQLRSIERGCQ